LPKTPSDHVAERKAEIECGLSQPLPRKVYRGVRSTLVLDVLATIAVAADEKDLEIALLRQQLRIVERKSKGKQRLASPEKLMFVVLVDKLKAKHEVIHDRLRRCPVLVQSASHRPTPVRSAPVRLPPIGR